MTNKIILCIGQCVLDLVHVCEEYPIEDTDRRCMKGHWQRGGNASNMVTVLSYFGAKCEFLGILSDNKGFAMLIEDFIEKNIIIENCPRVNVDVPFSSIILAKSTKSRTIVHYNPNYPILKYEHFKKVDLTKYNWIHFEGRNVADTIKIQQHILKFNETNNENVKISIELEKSKPELLNLTTLADYIFISKDFAKFMKWSNSKETVYKLRKLISNKNSILICPWGDEIISILTKDKLEQINPIKLNDDKILDTLGAGDTFIASTIYSLSLNNNIKEAVEYACKVTSLKLQTFGYDIIKSFS